MPLLYRLSERNRDPISAGTAQQLPLIERLLARSQRRVLDSQAVPAGEKLLSLFEPHADIIVKGARDAQYGHKLNLVTGDSGLILDVVVEAGNPADAKSVCLG
jgi:transposase, IS5 family